MELPIWPTMPSFGLSTFGADILVVGLEGWLVVKCEVEVIVEVEVRRLLVDDERELERDEGLK